MRAILLLFIVGFLEAQPQKMPFPPSPYPVSVWPATGAQFGRTFTAKFHDAKGGSHIAHAFFTVQAQASSMACAIRYDPGPDQLYLLDDSGNRYEGPIDGRGTGTLGNGQCAVSGGSVKISGTMLSVEFSVIFTISFSGTHRLYLSVSDAEGRASGRILAGTWTVPHFEPGPPRTGRSRRKSGRPIPPDPILPAPIPKPPAPITASAVDCDDVTGTWTESTTGGTWSLVQTGNDISGSLNVTSAECGSVSWQVSGKMEGKAASLHATKPQPTTDKCGVLAASSIVATLVPGCGTGNLKIQVSQ